MDPLIGELIGNKYTPETHDAARHVEFDVGADVNFLKGAALKFVAGTGFAMLKREVLQVTLARLITNRAIQGVVDEQKLRDGCAGFYDRCIAFAGDFHAIHDRRLARSHEFGHWAWIFIRAFGDAYKTGATFTARALERRIIAHCGRNELASDLACCVQDGGAVGDLDGLSVYGNFCHFNYFSILGLSHHRYF